MLTFIANSMKLVNGNINFFQVHPVIICRSINYFINEKWVQKTPENFTIIEDLVLQFSLDLLKIQGPHVYTELEGEFSIEGGNCIIDVTWIQEICDELKAKIVGTTTQLLQGETAQVLGSTMRESRLLKKIPTDLLPYNTTENGHLFDMFINFYLCFVLLAFKGNE